MEKSRECPNCGSSDVISSVRVLDQGDGVHTLSLLIEENPQATILRGWRKFPLTASVCSNCGYTELHVSDPAALREAHRRAVEASAGFEPVVGISRPPRSLSVFMFVALALTLLAGLGILVALMNSFR